MTCPSTTGYRLSGIFITPWHGNLWKRVAVHYVRDKRAEPATLYYVFSAFLATLVFLAIKFAFFDCGTVSSSACTTQSPSGQT